jgi:diaminohydroxyphosphoribosylaminopyrimidine deaminase/5-amino-6-(5-phosphoribosylamino)uracil reductase
LYVTLEPCCTHGRTPPCTQAIPEAGIRRVVVGATDPNPLHAGRGFRILRRAGVEVHTGLLADDCATLNEAFNHWILHGVPLVTVKAAMTLDGKIATAAGDSKWITGPAARAHAMRLRAASGAIVVGVNTVLFDDPQLIVRGVPLPGRGKRGERRGIEFAPQPLRVVLDSRARTPLDSRLITDAFAARTRIVVARAAPARRVAALRQHAEVWTAPARAGRIDLRWLLRRLGREGVTAVLVEGGGEVNAAFLIGRLAQRIAFYYAPKVLGGRDARRGVAGTGARGWKDLLQLEDLKWQRVGDDLLLTARVKAK